jgi:putative addiction module component (TIGR02574 family)
MAQSPVDFDALRRLSVAERIQLVEDLWDSIALETPDEPLPLSPELAAELDRRLADVGTGREKTFTWTEVKERILNGEKHGT